MRVFEDDFYDDGPTLIEQLIEEKRRKGLLPKTSYTKDEVITMLTELKTEIEKKRIDGSFYGEAILDCTELIQQKIDKLKEAKDGENNY